MMTIRFPNGQAVTYKWANFVNYHNNIVRLSIKENENGWIADIESVPGMIVETEPPCKLTNSTIEMSEGRAFETTLSVLRESRHPDGCGYETAEIKRALRNFNAQAWKWK